MPTEANPDALQLEFRPLMAGLPQEQAEFFAQAFTQEMNGEMDKLKALAELLGGMGADQREVLIEEMTRYEQPTRDVSLDFEL